jgi:hypothetical protein
MRRQTQRTLRRVEPECSPGRHGPSRRAISADHCCAADCFSPRDPSTKKRFSHSLKKPVQKGASSAHLMRAWSALNGLACLARSRWSRKVLGLKSVPRLHRYLSVWAATSASAASQPRLPQPDYLNESQIDTGLRTSSANPAVTKKNHLEK